MVRFTRPFWIEHEGCPIFSIDATSDKFATCGGDGCVRIWSVNSLLDETHTPKLLSVIKISSLSLNIVRFSPNGKYLAVGGDDKVISVWKSNGKSDIFEEDENGILTCEKFVNVCHLRGHVQEVTDLCWTSDGKKIISCSADKTVILWDFETDESKQYYEKADINFVFRNHMSGVVGVAVDPFQQYVASMDSNKLIIWDIVDHAVVAEITEPFKNRSHGNFTSRLSWSPDGKLLVVGSGVSKRRPIALAVKRNLWDVQYITAHTNEVICTRFSSQMFGYKKPGMDKKVSNSIFMTAGISGDCCVWSGKKEIEMVCCVTDVFDKSIQDAVWIEDMRMVAMVGLEGFLACIQFSVEELGCEILKPSSLANLMGNIKKRSIEEAEKKRIERNPLLAKELKEKELKESKTRKRSLIGKEEKEKENAKRHPSTSKTSTQNNQMKDASQSNEPRKSNGNILNNSNSSNNSSTSHQQKNNTSNTNQSSNNNNANIANLNQKERELLDKEKELFEIERRLEREKRLELLEEVERKKIMKTTQKVDDIERKLETLVEKLSKLDKQKIDERLNTLEKRMIDEKNVLLEQPTIQNLNIQSKYDGNGISIKATSVSYGKNMFTLIKCVVITTDTVLYEIPLPFELVLMICNEDRIIAVTKENFIIEIDKKSGCIVSPPFMNNGNIHNVFYHNQRIIVIECEGFVKVYNSHSLHENDEMNNVNNLNNVNEMKENSNEQENQINEIKEIKENETMQMTMEKILNIQGLLSQFINRKITDITLTKSNDIHVTFDNEISVFVCNGNYSVAKQTIAEQKKKTITQSEKNKVEYEIHLMQIMTHWDEQNFCEIFEKYFDLLNQTNDIKRAKTIFGMIKQLKSSQPMSENVLNSYCEKLEKFINENEKK